MCTAAIIADLVVAGSSITQVTVQVVARSPTVDRVATSSDITWDEMITEVQKAADLLITTATVGDSAVEDLNITEVVVQAGEVLDIVVVRADRNSLIMKVGDPGDMSLHIAVAGMNGAGATNVTPESLTPDNVPNTRNIVNTDGAARTIRGRVLIGRRWMVDRDMARGVPISAAVAVRDVPERADRVRMVMVSAALIHQPACWKRPTLTRTAS